MRDALRSLKRDPWFAATAIVTLSLGIGANTAMFTLADAVLFKPLFANDPAQLVSISWSDGTGPRGPLQGTVVDRVRDERIFAGVCGFLPLSVTVDMRGHVAPIQAHPMTGDCFTTLGIRPAIGRLLTRDDDRAGAPHAALLTFDTWMRDFGGSTSALTESINVDGVDYAIVGVTERGFGGVVTVFPARIFIPFGNFEGGLKAYFPAPDLLPMSVIARLSTESREATIARVRARWPEWLAQTTSMRLSLLQQDRYRSRQVHVESASTGADTPVRRRFRTPLVALLAIAAIVLLVTCVNTTNLLLARGAVRRRAAAVRTMLGASRARLMREALSESALLLLCGSGGAMVSAWCVNWILRAVFLQSSPDFALSIAPDARVFAFTAAVATTAYLLFAFVPAWRISRTDSLESMTRTAQPHATLRLVAITTQVALTMVLLGAGAFFVSTLNRFKAVDLGVSVDSVIGAQLTALPGGYDREFAAGAYYRTLLEKLEAQTGVASVALAHDAVFRDQSGFATSGVVGEETTMPMTQSFVSDRFFETLGVPLIAGTAFGRGDVPQTRRSAIVSASAARALFGDTNPIGKLIRVGPAPANQQVEIIGVARDAVIGTPQKSDPRLVYLNYWQSPATLQTYPTLLVRVVPGRSFDLETLQRLVREGGREYVSRAHSLVEQRDAALSNERLLATLTTAFAALGLGLAAVGLYGLLTFLVTERIREIGIRLALGATRSDVSWLVSRTMLASVIGGVLTGALAALAINRALSTALYDLPIVMLVPVATAAVLMVTVAAAAVTLPTVRAASLDPARVLRRD